MRSVVHHPGARCASCRLPLRWCLCATTETLHLPFQLLLLSHRRELTRPSSSGGLLRRLVPELREFVWEPELPLRTGWQEPGRECWVLHPDGELLPPVADATTLQVLLLDGSWREAGQMAQTARANGRLVRLPLAGESRYWLRAQRNQARWATAEALLYLLRHFRLHDQELVLRNQFELHVYASLRARGRLELAESFLAESPLRQTMPAALAALQARRSRDGEVGQL